MATSQSPAAAPEVAQSTTTRPTGPSTGLRHRRNSDAERALLEARVSALEASLRDSERARQQIIDQYEQRLSAYERSQQAGDRSLVDRLRSWLGGLV